MKAVVSKSRTRPGSLVYSAESGHLWFDKGMNFENPWPELREVDMPRDLASLPNGRRAKQGRIAEIVRSRAWVNSLWLTLVPSMGCAMSCGYCYARDAKPERPLDITKFTGWLSQHGHRFESALVYGGDGLNFAEHAGILTAGVQEKALVAFVSGLGFTEAVMMKKVESVANAGAHICVSIDPPGSPYTRTYVPYPEMKWYHELLRRIKLIHTTFPEVKLGFRPTITRNCYAYRHLREDLEFHLGRRVQLNFEPAEDVDSNEMQIQLNDDVDDINRGKLQLSNCSYLSKRVNELITPDIAFAGGGCGHYFQKVSVGPDGGTSFCHEMPTKPQSRDEWSFAGGYGQVIGKVYKTPEACQRCDYEHACGTSCPIKLSEGKTDTCPTHKLLTDAALQVLAETDPAIVSVLQDRRLENLRRWEKVDVLTEKELDAYASELPV